MVKVIRLEKNQFAIVITFMDNGSPQALVNSYNSHDRFNTIRSIAINSSNEKSKAKTKERYCLPRTYKTNISAMRGAINSLSSDIAFTWANFVRNYYINKARNEL